MKALPDGKILVLNALEKMAEEIAVLLTLWLFHKAYVYQITKLYILTCILSTCQIYSNKIYINKQ